MNINTNNYQEMLLLYIDGELDVDAQKLVEIYIEQNTYAKQEFDALLDAKLQIEDVKFGDISSLLKTENEDIRLSNYEENFLLYVDAELTTNQRKKFSS